MYFNKLPPPGAGLMDMKITPLMPIMLIIYLVCIHPFIEKIMAPMKEPATAGTSLVADIRELNSDFQLDTHDRLVFMLSKNKFTAHRDTYNTILLYLARQHDIHLSLDHLSPLWQSAGAEAKQKCTLIHDIKNPFTFRFTRWNRYTQKVFNLAEQKQHAHTEKGSFPWPF